MDHLSAASSYTDFAALNRLKLKGKEGDPESVREVARQLESIFVNQLLKSMRQANEVFAKDSFLSSNETKSYEQMLDSQLSLSLTRGQGLGLADSIVRQLSRHMSTDAADPSENMGVVKPPKENVTFSIKDARRISLPVTAIVTDKNSDLKIKSTETHLDKPITKILTIPTTPDEFIQWVYPAAKDAAKELGISPKMLVAQSALETGWGQKPILTAAGGNSHNLFGIKADQRWSGEKTSIDTLEFREGIANKEKANFRVYASIKESLQDYVQFLKQSSRYQQALEKVDEPSEFAFSLMDSGYATDPKYAEKIMGIFDGELLNRAIESIEK